MNERLTRKRSTLASIDLRSSCPRQPDRITVTVRTLASVIHGEKHAATYVLYLKNNELVETLTLIHPAKHRHKRIVNRGSEGMNLQFCMELHTEYELKLDYQVCLLNCIFSIFSRIQVLYSGIIFHVSAACLLGAPWGGRTKSPAGRLGHRIAGLEGMVHASHPLPTWDSVSDRPVLGT